MPWSPGQSGNPHGYTGPGGKARREVLERLQGLGHTDALETLSTIQNDINIDPSIRVAAASSLANYSHPKLQSIPTPRFIDNPIDVPHFDRISDAETFLAKLPVLVARGELDFQSAQELCAMTTLWINSQYQREELAIKQYNAGSTEHEQTIRIEGGLPVLPGCENLIMPVLAPPAPQIEANESVPTNGQGPHDDPVT